MTRVSWESYFLGIAKQVATLSTAIEKFIAADVDIKNH
jgi:hypothetical protein